MAAAARESVSGLDAWIPGNGDEWPDIGFVGCGTIAAATVEGLCNGNGNGNGKKCKIVVSPRSATKSSALAQKYPKSVSVGDSNQDVVNKSRIVFISVLPGVAEEVLNGLQFRVDQVIISLVSTLDFETLAKSSKSKAK